MLKFGSVKNKILLDIFLPGWLKDLFVSIDIQSSEKAWAQTDNAFGVKVVQIKFLRCNFDMNFEWD